MYILITHLVYKHHYKQDSNSTIGYNDDNVSVVVIPKILENMVIH